MNIKNATIVLAMYGIAKPANGFCASPLRQLHVRTLRKAAPMNLSQLWMANGMMDDLSFIVRQKSFGIDDKDTIKDVVSKEKNKVIFVDVRSPEEIAESSLKVPFVKGNFLIEDEKVTAEAIAKTMGDCNAPHVVCCAKGGRAKKAIEVLKANGFTRLYNGGGVSDLDFLDRT